MSASVALTIYKTVVDRAMYGYHTKRVLLPPKLFAEMKPDEILWLTRGDLLNLEISAQDGLTEPTFMDT